jgi:hypothetical protein
MLGLEDLLFSNVDLILYLKSMPRVFESLENNIPQHMPCPGWNVDT